MLRNVGPKTTILHQPQLNYMLYIIQFVIQMILILTEHLETNILTYC